MPTYAYRCTACDHAFEAQQSFTDESLTVCPQCEGRLRKVFSSVGVVFKGSGFYRTDARGGSTSSTPSAATPSASTPSAASTSTSSGSSSTASTSSSTSGSTPAAAAAS